MGAQALGSSAGDTCAGRAHGAGTCVAGGWQAPVPVSYTHLKAMGAGRAINGGSYYTFEADVLVIIGTDYQPIV